MDSRDVLFKIIQPWPLFLPARAIRAKTLVDHFGAAVGILLVDTFLMPGQVVHGAKAFFASAVGLVASELFLMPCLVFSIVTRLAWGLHIHVGYVRMFKVIRTFCPMDTFLSIYSWDNHMRWHPHQLPVGWGPG